jgi:nucleotide-binding universal stress UspA family protein
MKKKITHKKILVGIDYSKSSENALRYAQQMAERMSASIILLHVFEFPIVHTNSGMYMVDYKEVKKRDLAKLERVKNKALKNFPEITIETMNTTDRVQDVIKDLAGKKKIDLIVLGLETKSSISKFIQGSTGVNLASKIECPVVIVPEKYKVHELTHAMITVDNREHIQKRMIDRATEFTNVLKINSKLVHIKTDDEFLQIYERNPKKENEKWDIKTIEAKSFEKGVSKYVKNNNATMVIIFSQAHSLFYKLFNETNTAKIAFESKVPVVSIHE